jgi:AAA family ATP:ADP antiporter
MKKILSTEGQPHLASNKSKLIKVSNSPAETSAKEESNIGEPFVVEVVDETDDDRVGLLKTNKGKRLRKRQHFSDQDEVRPDFWMRPYWLGTGLFLVLFGFWLLDSLKDPVFAVLVGGDISRHQPPAKLVSVATTLALVCFLEFVSNARQHQQQWQLVNEHSHEHVLDGGGRWNKMAVSSSAHSSASGYSRSSPRDEPVSASMFLYIGCSYSLVFLFVSYLLGFHPSFGGPNVEETPNTSFLWHVLAYFLFAMVESFGSLTVATFWSFTNSSLSLYDAECYYGMIIAIAQLGAIGGATMVTMGSMRWSTRILLVVTSLVILLMVVVMTSYGRRFPAQPSAPSIAPPPAVSGPAMFWSGVHLILQHNYVLLILAVSCLYEVALTCLDYQMKLLGYLRFEGGDATITFAQFLGRFGQVTNALSLVLSSMVFPLLLKYWGLKRTLRIFPTCLVIATIVAYTALPANLTMLFISMSLLKAMTYSVHDPSKELLYLPTSNAIKFRAKFWIDVVGERIAKAIGSTINTAAGSLDRSIVMGSLPSILSALGLWVACWKVGMDFDSLIFHETVVGSPRSGHWDGNLRGEYQVLNTVEDAEPFRDDTEAMAEVELSPLENEYKE